jgi:tRNA threonylcarbamoyl adenosine modification protein (Sua5/YciO/YrdC/YwlC family)
VTQHWHLHPENPQSRLLKQAVERLKAGELLVMATDASYVLVCHIGDKAALDRLRRVRDLDDHHHLTLLCRDLSEIGTYAKVDNSVFRLLKAHTPGAYTFILSGTKEVPKRLLHPKKQTIGIRIPDHPVAQGLLELMGEPLLSTTLQMPGETEPLNDPEEIVSQLQKRVDVILDSGYGGLLSTTVVDFSEGNPLVLREGLGDPAPFQ